MRAFKTKAFGRFARKERIDDDDLREAVARAVRGLVDADLGGHLIKQRVARKGDGRSGGYRTIIVFRIDQRAVFLFGFAKNDQVDLTAIELRTYKQAARDYLSLSERELDELVEQGTLLEIEDDV